ncbi:MAG TPA: flagellar hook capping FlgD N-terminal domain-containing protein [Phycisphaerales bacterium]|nr:flagellar hook capping FlgD N-terminal domain-containing protein [Phycisphaerales bacterium]
MTSVQGTNSNLGTTTNTAAGDRFSDLSSEDFIKIIFTELSNQDPFQPNDSQALLQQLNSIRSIESDIQLTDQLKTLVTQNQLASSSAMIGKSVIGLTDDGTRVGGMVQSVQRQDDKVSLILDTGWTVPAENVEQLFETSPEEDAPTT